MIIETFHEGKVRKLYDRFGEEGRMLPPGVRFVVSWIDAGFTRCYQVMECSDPLLFREWIDNWKDLADFEIIPVFTSEQAREKVRELK